MWQTGITLLMHPDPMLTNEQMVRAVDLHIKCAETIQKTLNIPAKVLMMCDNDKSGFWQRHEITQNSTLFGFVRTSNIVTAVVTSTYRYFIPVTPVFHVFEPHVKFFFDAIQDNDALAVYGTIFTSDDNVFNNEPVNQGILKRLISFALYDAAKFSELPLNTPLSLLNLVMGNHMVVFVPAILGNIDTEFKFEDLSDHTLHLYKQNPPVSQYKRYHPHIGVF